MYKYNMFVIVAFRCYVRQMKLSRKITCDLGITLKHTMTSLVEMSLNVNLLRPFPDMFVMKNASGVRISWGVVPK